MKKQINKMDKFNENKLKSLEKVVGGVALPTITGVLDGVKHNTDFHL
ncbi:hypothetical protein [Hymenobacter elongatus]|nr:hypothetical protein [Hymenobacter elongatus]